MAKNKKFSNEFKNIKFDKHGLVKDEKYEELVREYGRNLIDEFAEHYDVDTVEHFEDMYQGQYDSGAEFAEMIASDCGYVSRDMPSWIEIDWEK